MGDVVYRKWSLDETAFHEAALAEWRAAAAANGVAMPEPAKAVRFGPGPNDWYLSGAVDVDWSLDRVVTATVDHSLPRMSLCKRIKAWLHG